MIMFYNVCHGYDLFGSSSHTLGGWNGIETIRRAHADPETFKWYKYFILLAFREDIASN